ncbi:MAG: hypothetical protein NTV70_04925 [Acidobacteria bacterium]|nr:hypothetical protein [Acidobacteriota bacterium]
MRNHLLTAVSVALLAAALTSGQTRTVGTLTSIQPAEKKIVVKLDAGTESEIALEETTKYMRVKPGETNLANAAAITMADLANGDRVLVTGSPATRVIVMAKNDIAAKQAADRADWDKRGLMGKVASIDEAAKTMTLTVSSGMPGSPTKTATLTATDKTVVRRYAPDSVKFSEAVAATLADVKVGDQVRARGAKAPDGSTITAEELVAGTFLNIAATVISIDEAAGTMKVTDLDTKKPVTVKITADSSMRRMPEMMARFMAMRMNGGSMPGMGGPGGPGGAPGAGRGAAGTPGAASAAPGTAGPKGGPSAGGPSAGGPPAGAGGGRPAGAAGMGGMGMGGMMGGGMGMGGMGGGMMGGGGGAPNPAQMMDRMPAAKLSELKPGDALIIASTAGKQSGQVTAITVMAGVEPILTAPSKNRQAMLGGWNLDMGGGGGMGQMP